MSFWAGSLKKTVKACDKQFTFAIPIIFFQCIYFRDVSLKNYLILYVKQKKNQCQNLKQRRGLKASAAQLCQDFPLAHPPPLPPPPSKLSALIRALLPGLLVGVCFTCRRKRSYNSSKHVLLALCFRWPKTFDDCFGRYHSIWNDA